MVLDERLKPYFCAVMNFNHTQSDTWLMMLERYAQEPPGPKQKAALRFLMSYNQEVLRDSS